VGKDWWDGVSRGKPADVYTAVAVFPARRKCLPFGKDKGVFTGIIRTSRRSPGGAKAGIVNPASRPGGIFPDLQISGPVFEAVWEIPDPRCLLLLGFWCGRSEQRLGAKRDLTE